MSSHACPRFCSSSPLPLCTAALQCMRRKKMFEKQIEQYNNQLLRLEEKLMQLEASKATAEVFENMRKANDAARANLRQANIDSFDAVLDSVQETQDEISGITMALERPIGGAQQLDDSQLLDELDEMETSELEIELIDTTTAGIADFTELESQKHPADDIALAPMAPKPLNTVESAELAELNAELWYFSSEM